MCFACQVLCSLGFGTDNRRRESNSYLGSQPADVEMFCSSIQ